MAYTYKTEGVKDVEVRLEAMRLALGVPNLGGDIDKILSTAESIYQWISNGMGTAFTPRQEFAVKGIVYEALAKLTTKTGENSTSA